MVMLASTFYTIYGLLWVKLFQWTKEAVEASSLLNIDILTQAGTLNAQDQLVQSIRDIKISQEFVQKIIDEGESETEFYEKYQGDTLDSHDIALAHDKDKSYDTPILSQQMFYTQPLVSHYNIFAQMKVKSDVVL